MISETQMIAETSKTAKKNVQLAAVIIGSAVVLGLLVLFAIWLVKKLKTDDLLKQAENEIKKSNLTYDKSKYESIASAIYKAMEYAGTDEETIFRNLGLLKNSDDWKQLIVAFGKRDEKNLVEYLVYELDGSEMSKANAILNKFGESI